MSFCGFVIRKGSWEVIHNRLEACSYVTFCLMVQMQIESSNNTQLYSKQRESSNRQSFILNDFYFPILFPTLLFPSHHFSFFFGLSLPLRIFYDFYFNNLYISVLNLLLKPFLHSVLLSFYTSLNDAQLIGIFLSYVYFFFHMTFFIKSNK